MEGYAGQLFVGIDLHRRRSVLVRMSTAGEVLERVRITNDPERLAPVIARAGEGPEVVLEATYGWYWAVVQQRPSLDGGSPLGGREVLTGLSREGLTAAVAAELLAPLLTLPSMTAQGSAA